MPDDNPVLSLVSTVWNKLYQQQGLPDALMRPLADGAEKLLGAYVQGRYRAQIQLDRTQQDLVYNVIRPYLEKHGQEVQEKANELADLEGVKRPFPFVLKDEDFAIWWTSNHMPGAQQQPFPGSEDPDPWNRGGRDMFDTYDSDWEETQLPGRRADRQLRREQAVLKNRAAGIPVPRGQLPYEHAYRQWDEQNDADMAAYEHRQQVQVDAAQAQRARNVTEK